MERKQNQTFCHGTNQFWHHSFSIKKGISKVNPNNENETKSDIFPRDIFKPDIIFIFPEILKCFKDVYNWHLKLDMCKSDSIFPYLQSNTLFNWLIFLDKIYLKNE